MGSEQTVISSYASEEQNSKHFTNKKDYNHFNQSFQSVHGDSTFSSSSLISLARFNLLLASENNQLFFSIIDGF